MFFRFFADEIKKDFLGKFSSILLKIFSQKPVGGSKQLQNESLMKEKTCLPNKRKTPDEEISKNSTAQ